MNPDDPVSPQDSESKSVPLEDKPTNHHGFLPGTGVPSPIDENHSLADESEPEPEKSQIYSPPNLPQQAETQAGFGNDGAPPDSLPTKGGLTASGDKQHTGFSGRISSEVLTPRNKTLVRKLLAPLIFLVLIIGVSLGVYYGYFVPNQPSNILQAALVNSIAGRLKGATVGGAVAITNLKTKQTINLNFSGIAGQPGRVDADITVDSLFTSFGVEVVSNDLKTAYVKFSGSGSVIKLLDTLGIGKTNPGLIKLLQTVNNQWYVLNPSLVADIEQGVYVQPSQASVVEATKTISKIYAQNHFFIIKQTLADQTIDNQDSYHYKVLIDNTKLQQFLKALNDSQDTGIHLSSTKLTSLLGEIQRSNNSSYPFDIWVTKSNRLIDQINSNVNTGLTVVNVTLTLSKINQPFTITLPSNANSILDLLTQLEELTKSSNSSGNPLQVLSGLRASL